jgi:hypothetical protein
MEVLLLVLMIARILIPVALTMFVAERIHAWDLRRAVA